MWDMEDRHVYVYEHLRNVTTLKRCPQFSEVTYYKHNTKRAAAMQPLARTGTADVRATCASLNRGRRPRDQVPAHESGHKRDDRQIDARDPRFPKDGGHTHTCMYICQDRMGNEPCGTWRTDMCMYTNT